MKQWVTMFFLLLLACENDQTSFILNELAQWPEMQYPVDNQPNQKKIALGERLFSDPILSLDSSISCASCHKGAFALADNLPVSPGVNNRLGKRNSPSLWNIGYHPYYMREGGVPSLEMQVLVPIQEHDEMAFNMVLLVDRLNSDSTYQSEFLQAFNDSATPYTVTRAIAQFERTLISNDAPIDAYVAGNDNAISKEAKNGLALFFGKANCSHCHSGPLFTNFDFYNNGTAISTEDYGRAQLTLDSADFFTFKVPSLRHIRSTAPYMHDGSITSLADVLYQYNLGGSGHDYTNEKIEPLNLNDKELVDLEEFLKTL